jgi:hypothetical protein
MITPLTLSLVMGRWSQILAHTVAQGPKTKKHCSFLFGIYKQKKSLDA